MSFSLLEKIFWHLQDCCRKVDTIMCDGYVLLPQFLWDNIPGQDEAALLTSLSNIFSLHEWDKETVHINKTSNGRIIVVRTPKIRIEIELDVSKLKAISTIKRDIDHRTDIAKYEYEVLESSFEIAVCVPQPLSESLRDSWECKRFLESIDSSFYDLVVSIKSDDIENYAVLAKDIKFMKHFDKVESEYQRMIQITKNLR